VKNLIKTAFDTAVIPQDRDGVTMIDARQLHAWLKVPTRFNDWIDRRITEYGFEADADFYSRMSKTGGRPRRDVLTTVDMAKELSMVERTARGQQTRRYFIEMEKVAHQMAAEMTRAGLEVPNGCFPWASN